jgi:transposase
VVSDLDKSSLLEVIDSHKSEEIIEVLKAKSQEARENVKEVSVDMWGGFQKVIKEVFPNALIVIDRFHVMKLVNKAVNKIRLLLRVKRLKKSLFDSQEWRGFNRGRKGGVKTTIK